MRSGGNSRRSELSDLFQFAATLGIHRELCTWPNWHSERAGHWHTRHSPEQGLWQWQGERHAGQCLGAPRRPPPARPRQRCRARLQQLLEPSTFCSRRTSLIHRKSRFFIVGIGQRRLRHQMRLFALITMVCSDLAYSSASSLYSSSKSGAPRRAATGCQVRTPRAGVWFELLTR